jgi:branched-chain amino acid aminotransferase
MSSLVSSTDEHADVLWRNGELVPWASATVHATAAGHASVSAVFEGIKAYWSERDDELYVFRLPDHVERLQASVKITRLAFDWSTESIKRGVCDVLRANNARRDTYVRPWNFVSGVVREQIAPAGSATELLIDTWPFASRMGTERGCRACVSSWACISDTSSPPRVKAFANYHNARLGVIEAKEGGHDWPIFLNQAGKVTEGPGACVGVVRDGTLITPSLTSGVLESITRDTVLRLAAERLGLEVSKREVDRTELLLADELFYMGTGWEILPILGIDGLPVADGRMGTVTTALDRLYHDCVRGRLTPYRDWLTPVWRGRPSR